MDTFGLSAMGALFFMLFSLEREPEVLAEEEAEEARGEPKGGDTTQLFRCRIHYCDCSAICLSMQLLHQIYLSIGLYFISAGTLPWSHHCVVPYYREFEAQATSFRSRYPVQIQSNSQSVSQESPVLPPDHNITEFSTYLQ